MQNPVEPNLYQNLETQPQVCDNWTACQHEKLKLIQFYHKQWHQEESARKGVGLMEELLVIPNLNPKLERHLRFQQLFFCHTLKDIELLRTVSQGLQRLFKPQTCLEFWDFYIVRLCKDFCLRLGDQAEAVRVADWLEDKLAESDRYQYEHDLGPQTDTVCFIYYRLERLRQNNDKPTLHKLLHEQLQRLRHYTNHKVKALEVKIKLCEAYEWVGNHQEALAYWDSSYEQILNNPVSAKTHFCTLARLRMNLLQHFQPSNICLLFSVFDAVPSRKWEVISLILTHLQQKQREYAACWQDCHKIILQKVLAIAQDRSDRNAGQENPSGAQDKFVLQFARSWLRVVQSQTITQHLDHISAEPGIATKLIARLASKIADQMLIASEIDKASKAIDLLKRLDRESLDLINLQARLCYKQHNYLLAIFYSNMALSKTPALQRQLKAKLSKILMFSAKQLKKKNKYVNGIRNVLNLSGREVVRRDAKLTKIQKKYRKKFNNVDSELTNTAFQKLYL